MGSKKDLSVYKKKRNFKKTGEPSGNKIVKNSQEPIFVVQLHEASHLHHDFRLEINGVLKSWAIPKGIPHGGEKRLAVMTEDHPKDYANFEGNIPKGEYGGGSVMVWDKGTYENMSVDRSSGDTIPIKKALENGNVYVWLNGKKLKGEYVLVKFKGSAKNWLLIRKNGGPRENRDDRSALTKRTFKQIESS